MLLFKLFIACGLIAIGALSVEAADMEMQMVDKNCWIEVFDDTKYDADDPHVKVQGPKEYASLKNLNGRDWNNEIQSVIVGSSATVLHIRIRISRVRRSPSLRASAFRTCPNWTCPTTLNR